MSDSQSTDATVVIALSPAFRAELRRALASGDAGKLARIAREVEVAADMAEERQR